MSFIIELRNQKKRESLWSTTCEYRGYYLCVKVDGVETRYFFGETFHDALGNFELACDKFLTDKNGWRYSVRRHFGFDVNGRIAWGDFDLTDSFC